MFCNYAILNLRQVKCVEHQEGYIIYKTAFRAVLFKLMLSTAIYITLHYQISDIMDLSLLLFENWLVGDIESVTNMPFSFNDLYEVSQEFI